MAVTSLSFLFLLLISFPGGVSDRLTRFLLPTVAALPLPDPSPLDVERFIAGDDVRDESDEDITALPALRGIAPDFSGVPILEELELALCFVDSDLFSRTLIGQVFGLEVDSPFSDKTFLTCDDNILALCGGT